MICRVMIDGDEGVIAQHRTGCHRNGYPCIELGEMPEECVLNALVHESVHCAIQNLFEDDMLKFIGAQRTFDRLCAREHWHAGRREWDLVFYRTSEEYEFLASAGLFKFDDGFQPEARG